MQIAMIGLGKMGANMANRLLQGGHDVVAFDLNEASILSCGVWGLPPTSLGTNICE